MNDRNGNPVKLGDRVYVLPEKQTRTGGPGWVRDVKGDEARVDNGAADVAARVGAARRA